ncbi:MAG: tRNA (guanosine(37)-N1)-methyltransferase TrmD [Firmicutes bacterium]|nr:tRNA (guanosine(37)-N1)-methyltransferase TrmD [Bacillota bacterium]
MRVDVLTLFPEMFAGPLDHSIVGRARERGLLDLRITNIRDFATDRHRIVDDTPYGGGPGMVMKPEPVWRALEAVRQGRNSYVILMDPQGTRFTQARAWELARKEHLIFLCGHYEGVDERVRHWVDEELSIGDYVLTGGELPAMVVIDAIARLLPGALGQAASAQEDSFEGGLLDHPQYTRPPVFRGAAVPPVLLSGHHEEIRRWRRREALRRTLMKRPDLLAAARLTDEDRRWLAELAAQASRGGEGEGRFEALQPAPEGESGIRDAGGESSG